MNIGQRVTKKIGRRRFLMISGKAFLGILLTGIIPVKMSWGADRGRNKFIMKIKPFKASELYQEHSLAG